MSFSVNHSENRRSRSLSTQSVTAETLRERTGRRLLWSTTLLLPTLLSDSHVTNSAAWWLGDCGFTLPKIFSEIPVGYPVDSA